MSHPMTTPTPHQSEQSPDAWLCQTGDKIDLVRADFNPEFRAYMEREGATFIPLYRRAPQPASDAVLALVAKLRRLMNTGFILERDEAMREAADMLEAALRPTPPSATGDAT